MAWGCSAVFVQKKGAIFKELGANVCEKGYKIIQNISHRFVHDLIFFSGFKLLCSANSDSLEKAVLLEEWSGGILNPPWKAYSFFFHFQYRIGCLYQHGSGESIIDYPFIMYEYQVFF